MHTLDIVGLNMKLRIKEILNEKGKTKYWLYIKLGLSQQNFNRIVNNETTGIKFDNLKAICDILECTPNDLFDEYHNPVEQQIHFKIIAWAIHESPIGV